MSTMDQNEDDGNECPLCMEPFEVDDIHFFPCTCGYQICRFCWHRIRTDENGLCPACRKAYSEDPAVFKPLSIAEFVKIKAEKRHKNQQKKQKITENRKSLTDVRVVQRNLVFVLGLPARLADAEILKKHEYFGKFGKILKVVINQSTSYAGSQAPCSSAYLTYQKSDDALKTIQSVNNITVDGRVLKSSLGTTKYCSHFLKNQTCPKVDCMYLHEMGDPEASFTKEEMQMGRHQEFEKRLHDQLIQSMQQNLQISGLGRRSTNSPPSIQLSNRSHFPNMEGFEISSCSARSSPVDLASNVSVHSSPTSIHRNKQQMDTGFGSDTSTNLTETVVYTNSHYIDNCDTSNSIYTCANQKPRQNNSKQKKKNTNTSNNNRKHNNKHENEKVSSPGTIQNNKTEIPHHAALECKSHDKTSSTILQTTKCMPLERRNVSTKNDKPSYTNIHASASPPPHYVTTSSTTTTIPIFTTASDNNSFFSSGSCQPHVTNCASTIVSQNEWSGTNEPHIPDVLPPVQSSEDWQAAFGFASCPDELSDQPGFRNADDLDFDPFAETQKALSEMLEKEKTYYYNNNNENYIYDSDFGVENSNIYAKKFLAMQPNNKIDNCSKLFNELYIGNGIQQRTSMPPPGFYNIPNQINGYNIGIPRSGNKLLPFSQQSLNTFQHNDNSVGLDLTSLDPALVTAAAHRVNEFYGQQHPPGFPITPVLDTKYIFNNYI